MQKEASAKRHALFACWDPNANGILSLAEVDKGIEEMFGHATIPKAVIMRAFQASRDVAAPVAEFSDDYIDWNEFRLLLSYIQHYLESNQIKSLCSLLSLQGKLRVDTGKWIVIVFKPWDTPERTGEHLERPCSPQSVPLCRILDSKLHHCIQAMGYTGKNWRALGKTMLSTVGPPLSYSRQQPSFKDTFVPYVLKAFLVSSVVSNSLRKEHKKSSKKDPTRLLDNV